MEVDRKKQVVRFAVDVKIDCPATMFLELVAEAKKALTNSIHIRGACAGKGGYRVATARAKQLKG